jgi:uncharacterized protein (TIGR02391 family)
MLDWFITVNTLLQQMRKKATDATAHLNAGQADVAKSVQEYLKADYQRLCDLWKEKGFNYRELGNLGRHIVFGEANDYNDTLRRDLADTQRLAESYARETKPPAVMFGFENLLHPVIQAASLKQFADGHLRDSVLNSVTAIFDLIRQRTGLRHDGSALATEAFAMERARLIFSEIDTDSGKNDQKGFMQIISGMYAGIRNPKAHSLMHDLDYYKAAQYLIFASLIARRVEEAKLVPA